MSRKKVGYPWFLLLPALVLTAGVHLKAGSFLRGDVDASGDRDLTDPVRILGYLYQGSPEFLDCEDAADTDDSGTLDLTDGIYLLTYLYLGGSPPPAPFESCGVDPTPDGLGCEAVPTCELAGIVKSEKERQVSPPLNEGELEELVAGNTAFALDLYGRLAGDTSNLIFSPHSISEALAMTHAGARNETARQMAETLRFTLPGDRLHTAFNALDQMLESRGHGAAGHEGGGFQLSVVNAIWGQAGYLFLPGYLDTLALNYGAGLRILDFLHEPEESRLVINDWVSEQTKGRIEDLLAQGTITPLTRLVLTNAVYFSAAWSFPFPEEATLLDSFHLLEGGSVTVPLMSRRADFGHYQGDGYQAVELPYDGNELSMVILLPGAGRFREFETSLNAGRLEEAVGGLRPGDIQLTLPRFTFRTTARLKGTLAAMGMPAPFSSGADFSGIDGTRNLYISDVLHKAYIGVDEAGTEAAAATAVVIGIVSVPLPVRVDRPFIFLIRDTETGAILFLGRVLDPAES